MKTYFYQAAEYQWAERRQLTRSSGENSADVDTESEDKTDGGLAWAEWSEREVEVLRTDKKRQKIKKMI